MQAHRPRRQDTFDLRDQMHPDDTKHAHQQYTQGGVISESEHSIMEDSSDAEGEDLVQEGMESMDHTYGAERDHDLDDNEEDDTIGDYMSDSSSSLSIPNESIDFDLVYSLTNFAATVEGQASVVKGDSLFLMDDSNSYWWLVRVLKTQEVGYIPAENIETPFERLARLNRHRNVDLASATQAEMDSINPAASKSSRTRNRVQISAPASDSNGGEDGKRGVAFHRSSSIFRYPPAVWNEEDEEGEGEWDEDDVEIEDAPVKDTSGSAEDFQANNNEMQTDVESVERSATSTEDVEMEWSDARRQNVPAALRPVAHAATQSQQVQPDQQQVQQAQPQAQQQAQPQVQQQAQQQAQQPAQQQQQPQLRSQTSRERLIAQQGAQMGQQEARPTQILDPAQQTETKKLVITPSIARDEPVKQEQEQQQQRTPGPLYPSAIIQKQQEKLEQERKRAREEIEAAEEAARKRAAKGRDIGLGPAPVQPQAQPQKELTRSASQETRSSAGSVPSSGGKLRKERSDKDKEAEDSERDSSKEKKKKGGVFAGLFGRKKDKEKGSKTSIENIAGAAADGRLRNSEESSATVSSSTHSHNQSYTSSPPESGRGVTSPSPGARQTVQQRVPTPVQQPQRNQSPTPVTQMPLQPSITLQVSQHASSLRERDQQQQALYFEYLKRSPSAPDQPSYATQSASLVMPTQGSGSISGSPNTSGLGLGLAPVNSSFRTPSGRPGSLILSPATGPDGQSGIGLPELSVIRVFAGDNLQSDATFKTVLLNSSTTVADLVRQSMQRFRLAAGEDASDYYLTVKQVEGSSLKLTSDMKPLGVFEQLVEEAEQMPKTVKRSSMGSISSVASNLSAHPAIRKLNMNDFTDDSAVKFYLNRVSDRDRDESDLTDSSGAASRTGADGDGRGRTVSASNSSLSSGSPERFSSPSVRFPMQLIIYPNELPDNMVFDPHTEAIVFKETLRDRSESSAAVNPGVSQNERKKYFSFPKNITVAEVIELGLERFGILEGVVDGGDEVEDKLTKRRSSSRVRYTLTVKFDGQERELQPSGKVIDAFPRPPMFRRSSEMKRRSVDSAQLLMGSMEDIQNDDPLFILRRAVAYRSTSTRHHRLSAPLDELALSHLHRDSASSDSTVTSPSDTKPRQLSRQEIIAAQRAASRANQKAVLSTQVNSQRGVDVMLPDKAMLRSQRVDTDSKIRYSYMQPDGETYDISDIVEEEFRASNPSQSLSASSSEGSTNDLLSGAMKGSQPSVLINRVLDKIKNGPVTQSHSTSTFRSTSPSMYSEDGQSDGSGSRAATPTASGMAHRSITPTASKDTSTGRSRSVTPTAGGTEESESPTHRHYQPSIESVLSDVSDYRTAASGTPLAMAPSRAAMSPSPIMAKRPKIPKDEFGLTEMLAVIKTRAMLGKEPRPPSPDEVEKLYFGTPIDLETVHPQVRDVYAGTFKKMKEIDMVSF
ncbi:uncharacterized protein FOMMEDRAFT_100753 [Fomitiporia mediterranea MF3/22]|uniref:uncharacterized protein n=1 Tax=Fomitiporia mediterranea (strain MF3/22) TaxID=694068 RepID=UPI0004408CDD|nr:uncharacterized protein FOMMEDRAFT_100753 [Fomitiporia mediterranea MF3/22]EJD07492.1 hypothetical protein FOMMEDRAFT_100753 [Fomitiporia mediterranea MF3/22]